MASEENRYGLPSSHVQKSNFTAYIHKSVHYLTAQQQTSILPQSVSGPGLNEQLMAENKNRRKSKMLLHCGLKFLETLSFYFPCFFGFFFSFSCFLFYCFVLFFLFWFHTSLKFLVESQKFSLTLPCLGKGNRKWRLLLIYYPFWIHINDFLVTFVFSLEQWWIP